jgi:hypothetical protein
MGGVGVSVVGVVIVVDFVVVVGALIVVVDCGWCQLWGWGSWAGADHGAR